MMVIFLSNQKALLKKSKQEKTSFTKQFTAALFTITRELVNILKIQQGRTLNDLNVTFSHDEDYISHDEDGRQDLQEVLPVAGKCIKCIKSPDKNTKHRSM